MNKYVSATRNATVACVIAAIGLNGCATVQNSGGTTSADGGCDPAGMALLGGILGALAGGRNNRGAGAAAGAAIGGLSCIAWNYRAQQTKTAEQVNSAYRLANNGTLPTSPKVVTYDVDAVPGTIASGSPMVINSRIGIVQGEGGSPPVVEQEITIVHNGKQIATARKQANAGRGAGEYMTSFRVDLPSGVPQGSYPVYTALYVNGSRVQTQNTSVQVVSIPTEERVAMID